MAHTYRTDHFLLRPVRLEDAQDLLACYSDPAAVALMNADHCTGDFFYTTLAQMQEEIAFWLSPSEARIYDRLTVLAQPQGRAVGTIEVCYGHGMLRIDLAAAWERADCLEELLRLACERFYTDFHTRALVTKAIPAARARRNALAAAGFVPMDEGAAPHLFTRPQ
ncbi:MAG: GNAT family N-acetyltransferase [Christensenellales bacterium]|jgi:ribosomal-protein-alanine N-acetyltransferase